jgi:hypothetical protein
MSETFLNTRLSEISDPGILTLLKELESTGSASSAAMSKLPLTLFLQQALYPLGTLGKRKKIDARLFLDDALLNQTLRKLSTEEPHVFALCEELARQKGESLEFHLGQKLATFLNRSLPK